MAVPVILEWGGSVWSVVEVMVGWSAVDVFPCERRLFRLGAACGDGKIGTAGREGDFPWCASIEGPNVFF